MSEAKTTTDHDEIRAWAEARDGRPAHVVGTGGEDDPGILRFDFGPKEDKLEELPWEEFFEKFDENGLALLYQEQTKDGGESRFFKFVKR